MKKIHRNLLIFFGTILAIKIIVSFFIPGPIIFSDETCVVQRALHFIQNFSLKSCEEIVNIPDAGSPFPLYSILIAPLYLFFHGLKAYHAILILNSILVSSLVFPLYSIFKKFIKQEKIIFLYSFLILFLSQVLIFEKMLMTESLFIVINVWLLHFYLESFRANKVRNKIISLSLGILSAFTRPFGFIVPLAIAINEIIISKKKKLLLITIIPISIIFIGAILFFFLPGTGQSILEKITTLSQPNSWLLILKAIKNQLNSFTIATFLIPIPIFLSHINKKDSTYLKKIKYFLISLIALNFIISTQHIYGYFQEGLELNLLTRYINISVIFIYIFALIFLQRYKTSLRNKTSIITIIILLGTLFFLEKTGKFAQNIDLLGFYKIGKTGAEDNLIEWIKPILFMTYALPIFLLIINKRKLLIKTLSVILIIFSIFSLIQLTRSYQKSEVLDFFIGKEKNKITYIIDAENNKLLDAWKILTLTNNEVTYSIQNCDKCNSYKIMETDYIITNKTLNLPIELEINGIKIYKQQN